MKITYLDGFVELQAEEGKTITTVTPSDFYTKLLYTSEENKYNYTEIDEVPEIKLPLYEEPNLEEQQEELNGYTLVEAYHLLLNENRVLKEENKRHEELIDIALMTTERMCCLLEPLINTISIDGEDINPLISMYADMVQKGLKQIEQIPVQYRGEVETLLV